MAVEGPEELTWERPRYCLRRTTWRGHTWTAWNMAGDRWLLEVDGVESGHGLLAWAAVKSLVSGWNPAGRLAKRVRDVELPPVEERPW